MQVLVWANTVELLTRHTGEGGGGGAVGRGRAEDSSMVGNRQTNKDAIQKCIYSLVLLYPMLSALKYQVKYHIMCSVGWKTI